MKTTRRTMRTWIAVSLLAVLFSLSSSAASDKWLHVRVEDNGPRGERVNVNLPLDLIERMLPLISVDDLRGGKLELDDELGGIDLRELAVALRDAPDADSVTVQSDDQNVRVSKEGDYLLVRVEERGRNSSEKVRVRLPLAVVDALVGGDPHELDLVAALHALSEYADETLVDIESDDGSVRVWIDSNETGL